MNHSAKMPATERLIMENITKHAQRNAEAKAGKEAAKKNAKQTKSIPNFRRHSFDGMGGGYQGL